MKRSLLAAAFAVLSIPVASAAQSPFDGTWKFDMNQADFSPKPIVIVLADGMFDCQTCTPAYKVKADGADQAISGDPYRDSVAIKVVDSLTYAETDKKNGNVVGTSTSTVSADGTTLTIEYTDNSNTNGTPPVTGKAVVIRVAPGPPGSHATSGSWKVTKVESSDNGTVFTYKVDGDKITMTAPTGQSYTATLDGKDAPMAGDRGITTVSVKLLSKNILEETDKRDGKVISVWTMTVADDGKTAKAIVEDPRQGTSSSFVVIKQ